MIASRTFPGPGQDLALGRLVIEALDPAGLRVEPDPEELVLELPGARPDGLGPGPGLLRGDGPVELVAERGHALGDEDDAEDGAAVLGALLEDLDGDVLALTIGHPHRSVPGPRRFRVGRDDDLGEGRLRPLPEERIVDDDGIALAARVDRVRDRLEREVERPLAPRPRLAVELGDLVVDRADARTVEDVVELVAKDDLPGLVEVPLGIIVPVAGGHGHGREILGGEKEAFELTVVLLRLRLGRVAGREGEVELALDDGEVRSPSR